MKIDIGDNTLATICIIGAVVIAASGGHDWGWLLVLAMIFWA